MGRSTGLTRHYVQAVTGQGIVALGSTARLLILGRQLSAEEYGHFSFAFSLILCCQAVCLGLVQTPIGSLAPAREGDALRRLVAAGLALQSGAVGLMAAGLLVFGAVGAEPRFSLVLLAAMALVASGLRFVVYPLQYSMFRFGTTLRLDALSAGTQVLALVAAFYVFERDSAEWAIGAILISEVITSMAAIPLLRAYLPAGATATDALQGLLGFARYSLPTTLASNALNYGSVLILAAFVPAGQLGGFAASRNLARLTEPATFALGNILRVRSAETLARSTHEPADHGRILRVLGVGMLLSMSTSLVVALFYRVAFRVLFSGKFMEFGGIVWLLSAAKVADSCSHFLTAILNGFGAPSRVYQATIIGCTVGVGMLVMLTGGYGVWGAAWASLAGALIFCVLLARAVLGHSFFARSHTADAL